MEHSYPPRPQNIPDNAIAKACVELRSVYERACDDIDGGQVVIVDGVDISRKVKAQSLREIAMVDAVIARSSKMAADVMSRGATLHVELTEILHGEQQNEPAASDQPGTVKVSEIMPEIGKYDR